MSTVIDYNTLVGEYFELRHGIPWYHSTDLLPSRFVDKGTIVEIVGVLPNDWIRIRF